MTKEEVLSILTRENDFISGEKISSSLGVSRAAVNAAVKSLRADGYVITSVTNRGYKLESSPDRMSSTELSAAIGPDRFKNVIFYESCDSTNTRLKALSSEGAPSGTVAIADEQTGGKGRRGRSFKSPAGCGIYLSYLLRPEASPEQISEITAWTAVAICKAISSVCNINPSIKWVNDILWNGGKLCGILTELSVESESMHIDSCIIGIGINVNESPEDFPEEIRSIATSLRQACGTTQNRALLAAALISELDQMAADFPNGRAPYLDFYRKHNVTCGKPIDVYKTIGGTPRRADAIAIGDNFSLHVRYNDGTEEDLISGEVTIRGVDTYS